jgi:YidC/Oxa1 family membrane protein insertase
MRLHSVLGALFGPDSGWAWGLSIVFLVMLIRLCLVPLFVKQVNAQRKMAKHQPQLMELRKKYKNDKQRLNEETMKFYKENGVNPLAGCLPMIPQMIVFFSLFSVLRFIADWKPGHPLQYGFTEPVVKSAQATTIFGVHLDSKLLFAHPAPSLHVAIVIALTVVISATTTFMTVRQTAKRGLMQTNLDPDNPMAQSQKFMQYIVPFFSLTGLYWQYGLVLYWVTTNLWTLGQQYIMFRNWDPLPVGAEGALGGATVGGSARSAPNPARPASSGSGSSRPASSAKRASGAGAKTASGAKTAASGARNGSASGRSAAQGSAPARAKSGTASGSARTGTARTGTAPRPATTASRADTGQNGTEKRGLLRFGRSKAEPEPQDDVPTAKVVRQQPVRQAKSKRSGKR